MSVLQDRCHHLGVTAVVVTNDGRIAAKATRSSCHFLLCRVAEYSPGGDLAVQF